MTENEFRYRSFSASYTLQNELKKLEIDSYLIEQLATLNAKISFPKKDTKKRNRFNVYVSSAQYIDGLNRICYIKIEDGMIQISEYKGARGDKYSGFYNILVALLKEKNLLSYQDAMISIPVTKLKDLIACINLISDSSAKERYILKQTDQTYHRLFNSQTYELPISYYELKENSTMKELTDNESNRFDIEELMVCVDKIYAICAEGTGDEFMEYFEKLEILQKYIEEHITQCMPRKKMIESARGLQ